MKTREEERIQALRRYHILDTPPDGAFDRVTALAAKLFNVPIAIVSLVDTDRIWFKSHHGIDVTEVDRIPGLCASACFEEGPYILNDASLDPRSLANPLVAGEIGFRFYSAVPLITNEGYHLGVLCIIDYHPRAFSEEDTEVLETLGQIVMDEIELRLSARKVNELNKEFELLIHSAGEAVCKVDKAGFVKIWNPTAEKITGYSKEEMLGQKSHNIIHHTKIDGTPYPEHECPIFTCTSEGLPKEASEEVFWRKDGTMVPVEYISTPIWRDGEVQGAVVIFKDLTEKKRTEYLLRRSDKLKTVGELAAGVAHEIRNPLTTLKGFLQILSRENEPSHYYEIMKDEIERIEFIANEFLVLSKPQSIKFEEKPLIPILTNVISLLESESHIKGTTVEIQYDAIMPTVYCEEKRLKQVFINIIKNSMDAMPNGGKLLIQCTNINDQVRVRIQDNGCGMDEERLKHLGEPFYSTKEKGTGLGLMVSYKIIQEHHGDIFIHSEVNNGTTVDIMLPVFGV